MLVYLDNSATTPLDPHVLEAMLPYLRDEFGNASSIHGFGQRARSAVEAAREQVAALIGARPREIIFTSGGTESDNFALRGILEGGGPRNELVTSTIEHPAVLSTCDALSSRGFSIRSVPVDNQARVDPEAVGAAIGERTALVSIMHANNETGTIQDIARIAALAHEKGALMHTDAVQTVGKLPVQVEQLGVDLLSFSAHKLHGPKGIGVLYVRQGVEMQPLHWGGHQERSRRAGTENVAGIVGLGCAAELARRHLDSNRQDIAALRDRLEAGILERIAGVQVNGSRQHRLPHISNLRFSGVEGEALTIALDLEGVAVSTGSACSSGSLEPSHVLLAMGQSREEVQSSVRFSLSRMNSSAEIDYVLQLLPCVVERLRSFAPGHRLIQL
jgi:cysteine desulfurase